MKPPFDITEVLRAAGLEPAGREGREVLYTCPFHADHRPSMRVNAGKQVYACPPCMASGRAQGSWGVVALANALGISLKALRASGLPTKPAEIPASPSGTPTKAPAVLWEALERRDFLGELYLARRGIRRAVEAGLVRFVTEQSPTEVARHARKGFRVACGLVDATGRLAGFGLRNVKTSPQRFRAVGTVKGTFYGEIGTVNISTSVVIVEGLADYLTLRLHSAPTTFVLGLQSAATMDPNAIRTILSATSAPIYLLGQPDAPGRAVVERIQAALAPVRALTAFPPAKDWNDLLQKVEGDRRAFLMAMGRAVQRAKEGEDR